MSGDKINISHTLDNNLSDATAAVARAGLGWIPFVGNAFSELAMVAIKNQWQERAAEFMLGLDKKLEAIPLDRIEILLNNKNIVSLIEKTTFIAYRTISESKREYIQNFLFTCLSNEDLVTENTITILDIFNELNDSEIIYLTKLVIDKNGIIVARNPENIKAVVQAHK